MLSGQEEQAERRRVFAQDQSLRASTYHQHAIADAETPRGRFSAVNAAVVVGSKADVASMYPAASAAHQTELPKEEPLGYAIDQVFPDGPDCLVDQGQGGADAPLAVSPCVEQTAPSLSVGDPAPGSAFPPGPARMVRDVGSPTPLRRRRL